MLIDVADYVVACDKSATLLDVAEKVRAYIVIGTGPAIYIYINLYILYIFGGCGAGEAGSGGLCGRAREISDVARRSREGACI